jgi:hypothetical protein
MLIVPFRTHTSCGNSSIDSLRSTCPTRVTRGLGLPVGAPLVKLCVLVGGPILFLTTADAGLRIWRSAWAWMPVNAGRGTFRLAWFAATVVLIGVLVLATWVVVTA